MQKLMDMLEAQGKAFEKFKAHNDSRYEELDREMRELAKKANRPMAPGGGRSGEDQETLSAFNAWARFGDDSKLRERNASMTTSSDPDGGYLVPSVINSQIVELVDKTVVMRKLANVIKITTPDFKTVVNLGGTGSGWVGESEARPATAGPQFAELTPAMGEVYAMPEISQTLLEDAGFNLDMFIVPEIARMFAQEEGTAFLIGNGVGRPMGLLSYPTAATADGVRPFGTLRYHASGNANLLTSADPLIDLVYSLKGQYRQNGVWLANSLTFATLRKFKSGDGQYLWSDSLAAGQPPTFLGYKVEFDDNMPDIGADAFPLAFGDFKAGYTITDRVSFFILRDPFTNRPFVRFYCRKRVGSFLQDSQAIRLLKIAVA